MADIEETISVDGHECIENSSFFKHEICCQIASNLLYMFMLYVLYMLKVVLVFWARSVQQREKAKK